MTTTKQVIDRIRREFLGSRTEQINRLAQDPLTGTTLAFEFELGGISAGARLSCELEDMYVWSVDPLGKTAVVQRGFESSTALAHPIGTIVRVSPRVTDAEILVAINNELHGLYPGVFRMETTTIAFTPSHSTYGLPDDVLDVYRVHKRILNESDGWQRMYGWIQDRDQSTTDFPSGKTLTFTSDWPASGFDFRVTYRKELGSLSTLLDVVETTAGTSAIDLIVLGAGLRLTRGRETARNLSDAQGSSRRAQEVPPGAELGANRALMQAYQQELFKEKSRLAILYPPESRQW